jgi:DNA helicase-2/ATP-dependent DNA helicase PcrA
MRERLLSYIGSEGGKVTVETFHSFALHNLLEKYFNYLGFEQMPQILSDEEAVFLIDEILEENEWQHLRPRNNAEMYFSELKQLVSLLKREGLTHGEFLESVEEEIKFLEKDPESVSTRGESKGKLKKEIEKKIESLERTREVVHFYRLYEEKKFSMSFVDYDDVLSLSLKLVEDFEDVRADIYENYLYVLVDEHQDSSGVQNAFLKAVWEKEEKPNVFVVGDDRQLIYAFSGASFSYFEEFSHCFGKTKLITLTENYRSSPLILSLADDLLKSSLVEAKLHSNVDEGEEKPELSEWSFPRDEIIGAGLKFKSLIEAGVPPSECALLVPRNYELRNAISIFKNMGLPVSSGKNVSLFDLPEAQSLMRIFAILSNPYDSVSLSESLLDKYSGIIPINAHKFLRSIKPEKLTLEDFKKSERVSLFENDNALAKWGALLESFINHLPEENLSETVSKVGMDTLIKGAKSHEDLILNTEVVRTFLHLSLLLSEKKKNATLSDFTSYLKRLSRYNAHIPLATFASSSGIQVMTLHKSKGLEYKAVWIAHMNEEVLLSGKKSSFTLPAKIKERIDKRDILTARRELYVAITRARVHCFISYSKENYQGADMNLLSILRELKDEHFVKSDALSNEEKIIKSGLEHFLSVPKKVEEDQKKELLEFVKENYTETKVSVTLLNNFFECPWKWYFRNFLKLPEVKSKSLALGSVVHECIESILKTKKNPTDKVLLELIKENFRSEGVEDKEIKKLSGDALRAVRSFTDSLYREISKDYISERPLQFKDKNFPGLLMYGKIDLTERLENGEVIITDFKTGSSKTESAIEKQDEEGRLSTHMRQLAMYSYLIAGAEKGNDVALSRLFYLEAKPEDKNSIYQTHVSKEQIDLLVRDIKDYENSLKDGTWMDRNCNAVTYGKNSTCEYCKMAEIYKN